MTPATAEVTVMCLGAGRPAGADEIGGKGAMLDRLIRAGFDVPPTLAVTADAYRQFVTDPTLQHLVERIAAGEMVPADHVDRAFLNVGVPDAIATTIVTAADGLAAGQPVAVRSSATVEDLAAASSAGQYRSSLNVAGRDALLRAVRLTWASLWHPAPCAYRRAWGLARPDLAMPVLLMRMVPARWAGVVFTVDPADPHRTRVEVVAGLGEALVSGARTPQVWRPERTEPAATPASLAADAAPADVARAAAALALQVERWAGQPQDVEWAVDSDRLWLVQSRPITTGSGAGGDGCDTPADTDELTTAGIGEMLPGVLPPLVWDINAFLVEEALRSVLGKLGAFAADRQTAHAFVRRVRGRSALDLDLLKAVAATLPGGSPQDLEREYFGVTGTDADDVPSAGRLRLARHHARVAAARRRSATEAEIVVAAVDEVIRDRPDLSTVDDEHLSAYERRLTDLGARTMTVELAVAAAATGLYQQLQDMLTPHLGAAEAASATQRLTAGAGLDAPPGADASRSVFAGPSWTETGGPPPAPAAAPPDVAAARRAVRKRLQADPRWRRVRWLTGQVVDVRIHVLQRLADDVTAGLRLRERVKATVLALGGEARRVHLEIGHRLCGRGLLDRPTDVDLLRHAEVDAALRGHPPAPAELTRRSRWIRRWTAEPPLPERFVGRPAPVVIVAPAGSHLHGWAASPGRYTGRACTVTDPLATRFGDDEVLVATATDAGWSPLFMRAGAIVVERGGPLSHAAIVARELGVPAVLNVPGATAALDGRQVTVDGSAGEVIVHEEVRT